MLLAYPSVLAGNCWAKSIGGKTWLRQSDVMLSVCGILSEERSETQNINTTKQVAKRLKVCIAQCKYS